MRSITVSQARAMFPALLDRVAAGEEIEITRHGRAVARLVPARNTASLRGKHRGLAWTADPADDLLTTGLRWAVEDE